MIPKYGLSLECEAMLGRLGTIRKDMGNAQDGKLLKLWEDKGDYRDESLGVIVDKLKEECFELYNALRQKGPDDIRDEIIDVRNVTEFLWDILELSRECAELRRSE